MKANLRILFISIIYWSVGIQIVAILRFVGLDFFLEQPINYTFWDVSLNSAAGGLIAGIMWGLLEIADRYRVIAKRQSFSRLVLGKTLVYIFVFFLITFFGAWAGSHSLELALLYLHSDISLGNFVFFMVAGLLFHFVKQISRVFGPGILQQYISGKYFRPKEEERIFMFLDLKSSTTIAEKLSHILYSELLQDCFSELSQPVQKTKASIYQYVGDEVVLTWTKKQGLDSANCLKFYFELKKQLEKKTEYFQMKYGVVPMFKAGLSMGLVTAAEVGVIKTEIAYHGDVLNTAARIQGFCNKTGNEILISETLAKAMQNDTEFTIDLVDEVVLRGKAMPVKIYKVIPK